MGFFWVLFVPTYLISQGIGGEKLEKLYEWKELDFQFTSDAARERYIRIGDFIPGNPVPIDVDTWQNGRDDRIFMTIPKFKDGVPASLVTVSSRDSANGSPLLKPYPDWSWHVHGNCDGLTSVFRTQIDQCGRLWAIDSGMVDLFKSPRRRLCQPQLVGFSLATDKRTHLYRFPDNVLSEGSILANVAIDVRDSRNQCSDTFAYVADVTGFSIIVYDVRRNDSWRVQSNTMYPYPPQGVFRTNSVEFDLMDGILGLALGPTQNNGKRNLYYHSFASLRESWVPTSVLKNESIYSTGFNAAPREFKSSEEARPSQSAPQAFDKHGVLYFSPVAQNAIYCWNSHNTFKSQNVHELLRDDTNLQFATGLKVVQPNDQDEELWVLTTRFHLVMVDRMRRNQVNFRIMKGKLSELTRDSPCHQNRPLQFPQHTQRPGFGHQHEHMMHGQGPANGSSQKDKNRRPGYGKF